VEILNMVQGLKIAFKESPILQLVQFPENVIIMSKGEESLVATRYQIW